MPFSPCEKVFDVPAKVIYSCDLLCSCIIAIDSDSVLEPINFIANNAYGSIGFGGLQKTGCIKKNDDVRINAVFLHDGFLGAGFNTTHDHYSILLLLVKAIMTLVTAAHYPGLALRKD